MYEDKSYNMQTEIEHFSRVSKNNNDIISDNQQKMNIADENEI